ncbi:chymotrypsin-like elastase family member 2B isoform X2 [Cloeon dipterum]
MAISNYQNIINVFDGSNPNFKRLADKHHLNKRAFDLSTATPRQFPWMALIIAENGQVFSGSLISDQWILTSAFYCSLKNNIMKNISSIILGAVDYSFIQQYTAITETSNYTCYVHELYDPYNVTNVHTLALIKMLQPVTFTVNIMPIKLPSVNDATKDFTNVLMTLCAFRQMSSCYTFDTYSDSLTFSLKYKEWLGVSHVECSTNLQNVAIHLVTTLPDAKICALDNTDVICDGVEGGPLVYKNQDGSWVIAGINTLAILNCDYLDGNLTVFTRVSSNLDWISSITGMALPVGSTSTPKATTGKPSTTTSTTKPTSTGKTTTTTKPSSTKKTTKTTTKTSTKTTTKTTTKTSPKTSTTKKSSSTTKKASG